MVFSLLAQKADSLNPKTILSGWLWRTTRNASSAALRTQRRREQREQQAYMQAQLNEPEPDVWTQIEPLLETAIAQLGEKDHDAVVLQFTEGHSFKEVSAALGTSKAGAGMATPTPRPAIMSRRPVTITIGMENDAFLFLTQFGPCPIHRKHYDPVHVLLEGGELAESQSRPAVFRRDSLAAKPGSSFGQPDRIIPPAPGAGRMLVKKFNAGIIGYGWAATAAGCHALDALLLCMGSDVVEVMRAGAKSRAETFAPYEAPARTHEVIFAADRSARVGWPIKVPLPDK